MIVNEISLVIQNIILYKKYETLITIILLGIILGGLTFFFLVCVLPAY